MDRHGVEEPTRGRTSIFQSPVDQIRSSSWLSRTTVASTITTSATPAAPTATPAPARSVGSRNVLSRLPSWFSRWLGYRVAPPPPSPNYIAWMWSFIGAFCGISLVQAVFTRASYFVEKGVPPIIASYGASAVLIYGVLDGPLAQPRALIGGHFVGALTGVIISRLFLLLPDQRFNELSWLAASLSCATAIVAMQITSTTHPPAGATAFLPIIDPAIRAMGWYFLPVILLTSVLVLAVALISNNIQRRYPVFWIQAPPPPPPPPQPASSSPETRDVSKERVAVAVV
ncbi:HPP-domain-containing protein [Coprinopsis marcescibilis]|uniref:HPP-domain-containing protein n=1 Tax=Coprinopsis marcescibilis TaxID=230819 RepID=A0A5C3KMK0_COPMA|nr:HPP-domain-containing protein [Coprinopsis marcescibilis]